MSDNIIFSITTDEVQEIAQEQLGRELTESEMETVSAGVTESHNILELNSIITELVNKL